MKRYLIIMETLEQSYRFMKLKHFNKSECILLSISMRNLKERLLGYYHHVMSNEIKLFGISKEELTEIYLGNYKVFEEKYKHNHGFIETELKSSSLANKELKIIKGYLKGNSIVIEDWWQKIVGENWQTSAFHNPSVYNYGLNHQNDYSNHDVSVNWVLYGKIGGLGYLVHVNELELPEGYNPNADYIFIPKDI